MAQISLENITLTLAEENHGVRVKSETENVILPDQTIENITDIILENFKIVKSFYESRVPVDLKSDVNLFDINYISVSILLHYLYMYNLWRSMYKKNEKVDLRFKFNDFDNPSTHDIILKYFITNYPNEWEEKCSILLGMNIHQLRAYFKNREAFYNK